MSGYRIEKRQEPLSWGSFLVFPAAVAVSLAISAGLLYLAGKPGLQGLAVIWDGAFGAGYALVDTLLKTVPIYLCSLGVAVAFRLQVWNIGAEGQYALGAVGATWMALLFPAAPIWAVLPAMFAAAAAAGALWAFVPAWLRTRFGVNEIISTLMLNYIGILFLEYLVYGAWKDPASFGFPMTRQFADNAVLPRMFGTGLHWGLALCVLCGLLVWVWLAFTRSGYEIRAGGSSPRAARYAHIPYKGLVLLVMAVCGGLAGWAGAVETSAVVGRLQPSVMAGYGYTAIVVAWMARLNPLYIGVVSFFLAALLVGVENLQLVAQVPAAMGFILEGLILLIVLGGQFFITHRIRRRDA
jgi:simple sugar transport system permease protein